MEFAHFLLPSLIGAGTGLLVGIVLTRKKYKKDRQNRRKVVRRVKRIL
jgi:predicted small secreted protein